MGVAAEVIENRVGRSKWFFGVHDPRFLLHCFEQELEGLFDIGPKTVDELLDKIVDDIERAERGEPVGLF